MPDFPIIDAHLHIWDPARQRISWQEGNEPMRRPFGIAEYAAASESLDIEAMVFVECFVDRGDWLREVRLVEEAARLDPRLAAIVANAGLEDGEDAAPYLEHLTRHHPTVRGIRRMIEFQPDPDFCLRPGFVEGVQMLHQYDLSFDINVKHHQMDKAVMLAGQIDGVTLILDHCGKPPIASGTLEPWASHIRALAAHPDTYCKLSDLPVEADWSNWRDDDIKPYIDIVVDAFGFRRLIYAGDWPVCTQATTLQRWVNLLDRHFAGVAAEDLKAFWNGNARRAYRF